MKLHPVKLITLLFGISLVWYIISDVVLVRLSAYLLIPSLQLILDAAFAILMLLFLYTKLQRISASIQKTETDFKSLFNDSPNMMWVYDVENLKFLAVNNSTIEKYGYTKEELLAMQITDLMPETDIKESLLKLEDIRHKEFCNGCFWKNLSSKGQLYYIKTSSRAIVFNKIQARVVTAVDITDQVLAEEKLAYSEKKLNALIDNIEDIIWITDTRGTLISYNKQFKKIIKKYADLDVDADKVKSLMQIGNKSQLQRWLVYHTRALRGEHIRVEEEIVDAAGNTSFFDILITPIYSESNFIIGVGAISRDVTQQVKAEEKIKTQLSQLRTITWVQSHELRRPLSNILGIIEALRISGKSLNEEQELVNMLQISGQQLDEVVNAIVKQASKE